MGAAITLGCSTPSLQARRESAAPAIAALQTGSFEEAGRIAGGSRAADADNPYVRLVGAIVRYEKSMRSLALDGRTLFFGGPSTGALNQKYLHSALTEAESELRAVEDDLAVVARTSGISMELCLACWEVDWNGNGRVDGSDRALFQIEMDANGEPLPEDDPRRKPTFRFDDGDIAWARAFVAFQRAGLDVLLAYDWTQAVRLLEGRSDHPEQIVLKLVAPERIAEARARLREGLAHSDASRRAYLAETDDDREWVPNPKQRSHPMPLPVDEALYATWEGVVGDVRRLIEGEEGVSVRDLLELAEEKPEKPPLGYLDVGRMLEHPKDIVLDPEELDRLEEEKDIEGALSAVLGEYYVRSMKPSPITGRLLRMKGEIDRTEEEFGRKLRYLLWVN